MFLSSSLLSFWDYSYMYVRSFHSFYSHPYSVLVWIFYTYFNLAYLLCLMSSYTQLLSSWFQICILYFRPQIDKGLSSHNIFISFLECINHCNVPVWWLWYLDYLWAYFSCLVFDHLILFCRTPGNVLLTLWWKVIEDLNDVIFLQVGFNILWQAVRKT